MYMTFFSNLTEFEGMTTTHVSIDDLVRTRTRLVHTINESLDSKDRGFLVSFAEGTPDWSYFAESHIRTLPAVRWKSYNLNNIPKEKRQKIIQVLKTYLGV